MFSFGALEISDWRSDRELTFAIFWQCVEIEIGLIELRWTIRLADRSIFRPISISTHCQKIAKV